MSLKKTKNSVKKDNSFGEVVAKVEEANYRQIDTDVPQVSEDGYIHDEPMLHGYLDQKSGVLMNTFTYREMDGRDEEAISKGEVKSNGAKLANVLVERCVSEIGSLTKKELGPKEWGKLIRNLNGAEIDYMMLKIREISKGKDIRFTHKCPRCGTKLITIVRTDEFNIIPFTTDEIPFSLPGRGYKDNHGKFHKDGVLRLSNGYDREVVTPLYVKNEAVAVTTLLSRIMSFNDGTPIFLDNIKAMSSRDRDYLKELVEENNYGIDMALEDIHCSNCGLDLTDERSTSDFF